MKRAGFKRPERRPVKVIEYAPRARATVVVPDSSAELVEPILKGEYLRSKAYRMLVAALPCAHCGVAGFSQAAHSDQGKGMSIKASDATCYPACGPHLEAGGTVMVPGCHWVIGTSGAFSRGDRRELEARYSAQTRQLLGAQ